MKKVIPILVIIVAFSCINSEKDAKHNKEQSEGNSEQLTSKKAKIITNNDFDEFLKLLDFVELPYETSCSNNYESIIEINQELIDKFAPDEYQYPYKRIHTEKNIEIIIFLSPADVLLPIINTYDLNGNLIDSEQMFYGYCGGEPGYYHTEHIKIESESLITHIDSTWISEVDDDYNEIPGTDTFEYEIYEFIIDDNGNISKVE